MTQIADKLSETDYQHQFIKFVAACTTSEQAAKRITTDQMRRKEQEQWQPTTGQEQGEAVLQVSPCWLPSPVSESRRTHGRIFCVTTLAVVQPRKQLREATGQ